MKPRTFLMLILLLLAPASALAGPLGQVTRVAGNVILEAHDGTKTVAQGQSELTPGDTLNGEAGSSVVFHLGGEDVRAIGPFSVSVRKPVGSSSLPVVMLREGKLRMLVKTAVPQTASVPLVETPSAVASVRGVAKGTDFFASYDALLGESEVIGFENDVGFRARGGRSDTRVKAGQWAGVGGRFGKTIHRPMAFPARVLAHFKALLPR